MSDNPFNKLPPQDLDAERGELGSVLLFGEIYPEVARITTADDFYLDSHKQIFRSLGRLHDQGIAIDALTVFADLERHGADEAAGGAAYLVKVMESVPHAAHAQYYARIVREKSKLRSLIYAGTELLRDAYDSSDDADTLLRTADNAIMGLITSGRGNEPVRAIQGAATFSAALENRNVNGTRLATGFQDADFPLKGGLPTGCLTLLGAGTGVGKTALAGNMALSISRDHEVLVVSLEMSSAEYYGRIASALSRMPVEAMEAAVDSGETSSLTDHLHRMSHLRMAIDDRSRSMVEIQSQIRCSVRKYGTKLVVIDYLQLVIPPDRRVARHEQIGQISGALKALAMELDISILALSQLSRAANEDGVRPQLHHLRESGSLEQDADIVLLLSRKRDETEAVLDIAKHRGGSTGVVRLVWRPEICRYDTALNSWQSAESYDPMED